jgi:hypothetical protein
MNTHTATRKTSKIVTILVAADMGYLLQVLLQAMLLLLMMALVCLAGIMSSFILRQLPHL